MKLLTVLLCATAFYVVEQLHFPFEFTVRGLNVYNVLFLAIWLTVAVKGIHSKDPAPARGAFYFLFFMLGWGFLIGYLNDSSVWVQDLTDLKTSVFYVLLYFLYYRAVQDDKTLRIVLAAVMVTAFLAQLEAVREGLDYGLGNYNDSRRASGPFGENAASANRAAAFYVIFVPIAAAFYISLKDRKLLKMLAAFSVGVGIFGLFVTYSRQGYFILAAILLYLTLRKSKVTAIVVLVALLSLPAWAPDTVIQRIEMTNQSDEMAAEAKFDESTESRFIIWEGAWQMIQDYPAGVGLNHFKRHIGDYVERYKGYDAHNNYIRMTAEASIFGALAMIIVALSLFRLGWVVEKQGDRLSQALGLGLQAAVMGVLMSNFYGSRYFDGDVMGCFWIYAALVARQRVLHQKALAASRAASTDHDAEAPDAHWARA